MVLGVYWCFGAPRDLYEFKFFKYQKGQGGWAGIPAELNAHFKVNEVDLFLIELKKCLEPLYDAIVTVCTWAHQVKVSVGGFYKYDFDFALSLEIEKILRRVGATKQNEMTVEWDQKLRIDRGNTSQCPTDLVPYLQRVGSPVGNYGAEVSSIRFDCSVGSKQRDAVLSDLTNIATQANIDVVYYLQKDCGERFNLMMFFTNGRQGVHLSPNSIPTTVCFKMG